MMRASLFLLVLAAEVPAAAQRPLPPVVQRFVAALDRGDLRALQRAIPRGAAIARMRPNGRPSQLVRPPVTPVGLIGAVRGCQSEWRTAHRDLADRSKMRAFLFWRCAGDREPMINLEIVDGRVTRIETGWEIEQRPFMLPPGTTFPPPTVIDRTYTLLHPLVGDRDFEGISANLPADATLFDRLRNRPADLAAIADHVEPCNLRDVQEQEAESSITRWACPDGDRAIVIGFDGDSVKRIEIVPLTAPAGGPGR